MRWLRITSCYTYGQFKYKYAVSNKKPIIADESDDYVPDDHDDIFKIKTDSEDFFVVFGFYENCIEECLIFDDRLAAKTEFDKMVKDRLDLLRCCNEERLVIETNMIGDVMASLYMRDEYMFADKAKRVVFKAIKT